MISNQWDFLFRICGCATIPMIFIIGSSFYAYLVNARKAPNDPSKKDYSPYGIWLIPISLPLLLILNLIFFSLFSLAFGVFLALFLFALLLFRKPSLFKWLNKQALKIGNFMLKVNTELLKIAGLHPISTRNSA